MRTAVITSALALFLFAPIPALAEVVINEIDYDQLSTDTAEFLELKNNGPGTVDLGDYAVELVNGTGGGAAIYKTITFTPGTMLAAGDYYVICGNGANVPNCDLVVTPATDLIQNGAPDAIGLRNTVTTLLVDAVSYEGNSGAPYTEGTGANATDSNTVPEIGISRFADGFDSNDNNADFELLHISPGEANGPEVPGASPLSLGFGAAALALLGGIAIVSLRRRATA